MHISGRKRLLTSCYSASRQRQSVSATKRAGRVDAAIQRAALEPAGHVESHEATPEADVTCAHGLLTWNVVGVCCFGLYMHASHRSQPAYIYPESILRTGQGPSCSAHRPRISGTGLPPEGGSQPPPLAPRPGQLASGRRGPPCTPSRSASEVGQTGQSR